jgi:hypothetical protein
MIEVAQDSSLINERRGAVTAHDDVALILAGRERRISFDVPSLSLRAIELKKKLENHKYKAFYPEVIMKEKLTALQPLPNRPRTPNTLRIAKEKDEKQKKHLTSFIDHFMQSEYSLTKPRRVLVKDRDFLHLIGEVNGSRYNYCGRPELELFVIGMESPEYYQQSYHSEVKKEENLSSFSSRSRTPNRPISAISRPISASITASSLGKIDGTTLVSSLNELKVSEMNEITTEGQPKNEERRSSIQPSTAVIPVSSSGNAVEQSNPPGGNETPSTPSHLALQQHIIPHRILTLSYDYKTNYNMKTISLLYDPSKCLIIMSEKMEVELLQMLMESYQHNLQVENQEKLKKEKEEREKKEKEEGIIAVDSAREEIKAPEGKDTKLVEKKEEKKETGHNKRKTTRETTIKKKKVALLAEDKHATTTDEESESEKRPKSAFTTKRIDDNMSIYGEKITELILLQSFYYIGNDETIHTFDKERITLWKRFYSKYLLPFFASFLSAYSFHCSMINNVLRERMNQIDHHIELNIHRSILDDSQSEDSDSFGSRDGKKKHRKTTKKTMIQQQQQPTRSSIAISADLKKKQRMTQSFQQASTDNNLPGEISLHAKSASIIAPNRSLKTISLKKNDVIHAAIAQAVHNVNNADSEKEEENEDEEGQDGNTQLDIRRRNNIKPIFIPKDSQNSKKKKPSLLSLSASSDKT